MKQEYRLFPLYIEVNGINSVSEARAITGGGFSTATKMPCPTYSIPAFECKTGSKLAKIPGTTCSKCYALKTYGGWYTKSHVLQSMYRRFYSLKNPKWVDAFVFLVKHYRLAFFRWHDSGDIQGIWHLQNLCDIALACPDVKFWLPTTEHTMVKLFWNTHGQIPFKELVPNLCIRLSAIELGAPAPIALARELGCTASNVSTNQPTCPAHEQYNYCRSCRHCWDNKEESVTYLLH